MVGLKPCLGCSGLPVLGSPCPGGLALPSSLAVLGHNKGQKLRLWLRKAASSAFPSSEHRQRLSPPRSVSPKFPAVLTASTASSLPSQQVTGLPLSFSPPVWMVECTLLEAAGLKTLPQGSRPNYPHSSSGLMLLPANRGGSASSQNPLSASCAAFTPACLAPLPSLPTCLLPLLPFSTFTPVRA